MLRVRYGKAIQVAKPTSSEPVWNVIMPAGEWHRDDFPNGKEVYDRKYFEAFIANWKKIGSPGLPINRHHRGSSHDDLPNSEKGAVGFFENFRISASGDFEALCAWNEDGREDITKDRRRYISPEWLDDAVDPQTGQPQGPTFFGGALLNDPFFKTLPRLAASDSPSKENLMTREELIELYGLPKTASDADIKAAARNAAQAATAAKTAADDEVKRNAAAAARTGELEAQLKTANEKLATAATAKLEADGTALAVKLETEGRITAAEKVDVIDDVKSMGIEKATTRWAKRPVIVTLEGGKPGARKDGDDKDPKVAAAEFDTLVATEMEKSKTPYSQASRRVGAAHPELYRKAMQPAVIGSKDQRPDLTRH